MVVLRCGKIVNTKATTVTSNEMDDQTGIDVLNKTELDIILKPIEVSINTINNTLLNIRNMFNKKIESLQSRLAVVEARCAMNENFLYSHTRKIDDNEQYSRKQNLKLIGIELQKKESPRDLMEKIQKQVGDLEIDVDKNDYDRCHRNGNTYQYNGKTCKDVLLRLRSWDARDKIYRKRKELPFKVAPDLTVRREKLLKYAKDECDINPHSKELVEFVFCDGNCKMKVFTKEKQFFAFNSEQEYLNIINRLHLKATASEAFIEDEKNGRPDASCPSDLFY